MVNVVLHFVIFAADTVEKTVGFTMAAAGQVTDQVVQACLHIAFGVVSETARTLQAMFGKNAAEIDPSLIIFQGPQAVRVVAGQWLPPFVGIENQANHRSGGANNRGSSNNLVLGQHIIPIPHIAVADEIPVEMDDNDKDENLLEEDTASVTASTMSTRSSRSNSSNKPTGRREKNWSKRRKSHAERGISGAAPAQQAKPSK